MLGRMHEAGEGAPTDMEEAARWYLLAANNGHLSAQILLGRLYARDDGVGPGYAEAEKWLVSASRTRNKYALKALAEFRSARGLDAETDSGSETN
jgi:TPR repeat protein